MVDLECKDSKKNFISQIITKQNNKKRLPRLVAFYN